jgi:hypothetical protein
MVNNGAVPVLGEAPTIANTNHFHIVGAAGNDNISLDESNGVLPGAALFGGDGNDTLTGGSGEDFLDGGIGNDTALMGAGDDTFGWNQGDGSDRVDGQAGSDDIVFNSSDAAEKFDLSDSGNGAPFHRVRVTRDVGNVNMDLSGIEEIDLNANGGADTVSVNDLTATDVFGVKIDLGGVGFGDGAADAVIINGTTGDDAAQIASFGTTIGARVSLFPFVSITGSEGGSDTLSVNTLGGNDIVDASGLAATNASQLIRLTENGGAGNDTLIGSQGADTFVWNPGDGSDSIDGGDNPDTLVFNGSDQAEKFDLSANGSRVGLARDVGGVTMDLGGVETLTVNPLGGADAVTVNDLTGTAVGRINLNLSAAVGGTGGDGQVDSVFVNGSNGADSIPVAGLGGLVVVSDGGSLPYFMVIRDAEASDALRISGNGGNDTIDAGTLQTQVTFTADGGAGDDVIVGSAGDDTFLWNPGGGSDTMKGRGGTDTLNFNGSNAAENIDVSANGSRVRLTDDAENAVLDVDGVEQAGVSVFGGADQVRLHNLAGTAVTNVKVKLNADGQPDGVVVDGSDNADTIGIEGDAANGITVTGLAALLEVVGTMGMTDGLTVNSLGGADTIEADIDTPMTVGIDGGAGRDAIGVLRTAADGLVRVLPGTGSDDVHVDPAAGDVANVAFDATQRLGALNIGSGGVAVLSAGGGKALTVTSLGITGSGKLNLNDNALIVDYALASPIAAVQSLLKSGYNGGGWDGNGIMTGLGNRLRFALGFAEASDVAAGGMFAGQAVDGTAVVVKFTLYGDADLDGAVGFSDVVRMAQHFNSAAGATWARGDFDYDGAVGFSDLVRLAQNYDSTAVSAAAPAFPAGIGLSGRATRPGPVAKQGRVF